MIPLRNQYPNRFTYNPFSSNPYASSRARTAGLQGVNFGVDMQIPGMPPAPPPPVQPKNQFNMNPTPEPEKQVPGVNQPMDFAAEYAKLNSNRPNRLAYQQAVNEGEPTIQRGKWAKLAALIAGAGGGISEGATAGTNLGLSSYYEPQRKASEKYDKKLRGLERLAGYEDSDMANQIRALEIKENQYWKTEDAKRANKLTDIQIKQIEQQMREANIEKWTDPTTGIQFRMDLSTGEVTNTQQKRGLSLEESLAQAKKVREAEVDAERPERESREYIAEIGAGASTYKAQVAASTAALRMLQAGKDKYKPGDVMGNATLDIGKAIARGELPLSAANWLVLGPNGVPYIHSYIGDQTDIDNANKILAASLADRNPRDSSEIDALITSLTEKIKEGPTTSGRASDARRAAPTPAGPGLVGPPPVSSSSPASPNPSPAAAPISTPKYAPEPPERLASVTRGNPKGTVIVRGGDGNEWKVLPEEVPNLKANDPKTVVLTPEISGPPSPIVQPNINVPPAMPPVEPIENMALPNAGMGTKVPPVDIPQYDAGNETNLTIPSSMGMKFTPPPPVPPPMGASKFDFNKMPHYGAGLGEPPTNPSMVPSNNFAPSGGVNLAPPPPAPAPNMPASRMGIPPGASAGLAAPPVTPNMPVNSNVVPPGNPITLTPPPPNPVGMPVPNSGIPNQTPFAPRINPSMSLPIGAMPGGTARPAPVPIPPPPPPLETGGNLPMEPGAELAPPPPMPANPITLAPPVAPPGLGPGPRNPFNLSESLLPKGVNALPAPPAVKPKAPVAPKVGPVTLDEARATEPRDDIAASITKKYPPQDEPTKQSIAFFQKTKEQIRKELKQLTGYDLKFISLKRTPEEQYREWLSGRLGDKGPIKTNADGYISKSEHQGDEAADIRLISPKGKSVPLDYEKYKDVYNALGKIVRENGITWGGEWGLKPGSKGPFDPAHFQLREVEKKPKDPRSDRQKFDEIQRLRKAAGVKGVK